MVKLTTIQQFMDKNGGGEEGLMKALTDANEKKKQKDELQKTNDGNHTILESATTEMEKIQSRENEIELRESEIKVMGLIARNMPAIRKERKELAQEKIRLTENHTSAQEKLTAATENFQKSNGELETFLSANDYSFYEQILTILDIGNEDFKDDLKAIAQQTLDYIDGTNFTLTGARKQLGVLLDQVKQSVDVSSNTSEKITVLQQALAVAQDKNAKGYQGFKAAGVGDPADGLDVLERKKIEQTATHFTSELSRAIASSVEISGNVETHQTTMGQLRTDLENGVVNADSQLLKAVSTSAATGQTMLQRTQRLAAMSQAIVADSMYQQELKGAFESVNGDFAAELNERAQRNSQIDGFAALIYGLSKSLSDRNDQAIVLAQEQVELVEKLASNIKKLETSNKNADEIDATIAVAGLNRNAGLHPAA